MYKLILLLTIKQLWNITTKLPEASGTQPPAHWPNPTHRSGWLIWSARLPSSEIWQEGAVAGLTAILILPNFSTHGKSSGPNNMVLACGVRSVCNQIHHVRSGWCGCTGCPGFDQHVEADEHTGLHPQTDPIQDLAFKLTPHHSPGPWSQ